MNVLTDNTPTDHAAAPAALNGAGHAGVDQKLAGHYHSNFSRERVRALSQTFRRHGLVRLRDIVPDDLKDEVRGEVLRLLAQFAERRDLRLATTGNTPRRMSVVRSERIGENSGLLREIYASPALGGVLSTISGEDLIPCPSRDEEFLITRHETPGDTHGWHWGDYPVALIWLIQAPGPEHGGLLQCVPHTDWDKANPQIYRYLCENPIYTYHFGTGDIYFLRTDTTLHRTTPLEIETTRIILNMTWSSTRHAARVPVGDDRWWENVAAAAARPDAPGGQ
jgi:L-lysine 4-chlorinase